MQHWMFVTLAVLAQPSPKEEARQRIIDQIESGPVAIVFVGVPARAVSGFDVIYQVDELYGYDKKIPGVVFVKGKDFHGFYWEPNILDIQFVLAKEKALGIIARKAAEGQREVKVKPIEISMGIKPEIITQGEKKKKPVETIDIEIPDDMKMHHPPYKLLKNSKRNPKTFYKELWHNDADQEKLRAMLASVELKYYYRALPTMHFYKPQTFITKRDWEHPWSTVGGMNGIYGWKSFVAVSDPPVTGEFIEGEDYDGGQIAIDMLVDDKTSKVFTVNVRNKDKNRPHWYNTEAAYDIDLFPKGYTGAGVCNNCHGTKHGINAPDRSKDTLNSFPR